MKISKSLTTAIFIGLTVGTMACTEDVVCPDDQGTCGFGTLELVNEVTGSNDTCCPACGRG